MMKSNYALLILSVFFSGFGISCGHSPTQAVKEEVKPPQVYTLPYPAISTEEINKLFSIAEKVDMIFYDLPMSVNQEDAKSAKNTVLYISPAPAVATSQCKALGRLSWISKGAIVKEADIYCRPGCQYFIFMENNKPVAANAMGESGVEFFNQIISQAAQQQPK